MPSDIKSVLRAILQSHVPPRLRDGAPAVLRAIRRGYPLFAFSGKHAWRCISHPLPWLGRSIHSPLLRRLQLVPCAPRRGPMLPMSNRCMIGIPVMPWRPLRPPPGSPCCICCLFQGTPFSSLHIPTYSRQRSSLHFSHTLWHFPPSHPSFPKWCCCPFYCPLSMAG